MASEDQKMREDNIIVQAMVKDLCKILFGREEQPFALFFLVNGEARIFTNAPNQHTLDKALQQILDLNRDPSKSQVVVVDPVNPYGAN